MNTKEIWKDVDEFPNVYQVSNYGQIRRIGDYSNQSATWKLTYPKIITQTDNTRGYMCVKLSYRNKTYTRYVHRLVATAFCDNLNPSKYTEVNHIDGDKTNNTSENLEWCDRSYNNKHAYIKGLHTLHGCYGCKKAVAQVDMSSNKIVEIYESVEYAAKQVGLKNYANISACCNYAENPNKYKRPCLSSMGYKWRFVTNEMKVGDVIK